MAIRRVCARLFNGSVLALVLSLAGGCGESDEDASVSGSCASLAATACSKLADCAPILVEGTYGDEANCKARIQIDCEADVGAPGSLVGPEALSRCASAYSSLSCEALLNNDSPEACDLAGERNAGSACGANTQCESQYCKISGTSACGTCAAKEAAGGNCESNEGCQSGLVCVSSVCATPIAAGGTCTNSEVCTGNLICKSGTCAEPAGAGEPCQSFGDCNLLEGLGCDPQAQVCKKLQLVGPGESCGLIGGNLVVCGGGGSCEGGLQGTCAAPAADGEACNPTGGPDCLAPAECVNGTCQLPNPASCG